MAKCFQHPRALFADSSVCPQCKACKHTHWWKREGEATYQCSNCFIQQANPAGEKWILTKGKWQQEN